VIIQLDKMGLNGEAFDLTLSEAIFSADPLADAQGDPVSLEDGRFQGTVAHRHGAPRLDGILDATIRRSCVRCLEPADSVIRAELSLKLVPQPAPQAAGETEMDPDLTHTLELVDGRVDLVEVARETVFLQLGLRPLCQPDCEGLCPTCGINRNLLECDCAAGSVDPRLEPLRALRESQIQKRKSDGQS